MKSTIKLRRLQEAKVRNKFVLVRVDFNVPMKGDKILDDSRIKAALPTIKYLLNKNACVILMSHLGRPDGKFVASLCMDHIADRLSVLLKKPVFKLDDCIGPDVESQIEKMRFGSIVLLENLRFYPEEENNDSLFAQSLSNLADIYVNDAFAVMHRAHASVSGIAKYTPAYAGLLVQDEVKNLSRLKNPAHPYTAIIGGAKTDKLGLIKDLLKKVDSLIVGGLLANVLLKARGEKISISVDSKTLAIANQFCKNKKLVLPVDFVINQGKIADIGSESVKLFKEIISKSKTIFWAGPLGIIESPVSAKGTYEIAKSIAKSKSFKVIGGGTSAEVIYKLKLEKRFSWVSTGGGASIAFVQGRSLPGLEVLQK